MADRQKQYIAIDLKSFYASVEAVARGLDPLTVNLVVADPSRTEKTICLAVSPSLKAYGISGRARLFEVIQRVKEVNAQNPSQELTYIVAPPRMKLYETVSTQIFSIYMKYVSPDDMHVYSIDECFMDVTAYLNTYGLTAHELAMTMIRDVLKETGITATAGIGTNMYLAKIAMDVVAKHVPADEQGVRIAELDEQSYRELLWCHRPITDFWRVGRGTAKRLEKLGCYTMGDVARLSELNEDLLYRAFGINAELLIDHAWGFEPTEIATIKSYRPQTNSLSSGQVLMEPYDAEKAKLIVKEMTELLVLDLVKKNVVTKQINLTIGYDRESLQVLHPSKNIEDTVYCVAKTGKKYTGIVTGDPYGRALPKYAHGTGNLDRYTSSTRRIMEVMMELYDRIVDGDLLIRRVTVAACALIPEKDIPPEEPEQLDLFTDYEARDRKLAAEKTADEREKRMQKATILLQERFGKNAVLKGMNLVDGAMTIKRNGQIGGHSSGE